MVNPYRFNRAVCQWKTEKHFAHSDVNLPTHSPASDPHYIESNINIWDGFFVFFYHVRCKSRSWIRGVWQRTGEARTGRGGESSRSRIRAEGWSRRRPRQVFVPRGSQSRGPVSRTRIKSQRARGLVEVTLRIGHWWTRDRSPIPKREV